MNTRHVAAAAFLLALFASFVNSIAASAQSLPPLGAVLETYKDTTEGLSMVIVRQNVVTLFYFSRETDATVYVMRQDTPASASGPASKAGDIYYPEKGEWKSLAKLDRLVASIPDPTIRELAEKARQTAMQHVSAENTPVSPETKPNIGFALVRGPGAWTNP